MPVVNLTLFGGFEARLGSRGLTLPRKAQALLAYLAVAPAPSHTRGKLADLLWSDAGADEARNSLRQVLFRMRRASGKVVLVAVEGEAIRLAPGVVDSDVARFRALVARGGEDALREAAQLYRGSLLDGLDVGADAFEEWLAAERGQLHQTAVDALARILARDRARGEPAAQVATALRLLALDPLQEDAHRALMRAYAAQGRRAAALRQYQICVEVLQRELQTGPEPATAALYVELLREAPGIRATAPGAPAARSEHVKQFQLPLVGRDAALATLVRELDRAETGPGRLVAVHGEAGVGKTRLVEEVVRVAARRGWRIVSGRAYETEQTLPLGLWATAMRWSGVVDGDALADLAPEWRDALGPLFPDLPGRRRRGSIESENERRLFEALGYAISTLAAARPVLVVLEDVQWADASSLRLLAFLGRRLGARACVIVTARVEDEAPGGVLVSVLSELRAGARMADIALMPLTRNDTRRLFALLSRRSLRDALAERVWRMSEGNPFVVVEAVRALGDGRASEPGAGLPLPERVRRLVCERIDRLDRTARNLAAAAAVIGGAFDYPLLRRAAAVADAVAAEAIEELVRRHVFVQVDEGFDFAHDRIREAVLGTLLEPRRRRLHLAVAAAIEEWYAGQLDEHHATLAAHYRDAGEPLRAVDSLRQASVVAATRGAFRDSAALLEQALQLLPDPRRERGAVERAIDVRLELRDRVYVLPDFERAERSLLEAHALARAVGDERRAALAAAGLANHDVQVRNLAVGRARAEEALAVAERLGDGQIGARAALALGLIRAASGDVPGAIDVFGRGIVLAGDDPLATFSVGAGLCLVHLRGWQSVLHGERGDFDAAVRLGQEALDLAESVSNIFSMAFARLALGRILLTRGEVERALALLGPGRTLVETYEIGLVRRVYTVWLAEALAMAARPAEALALALQAPPAWPHASLTRARALVAMGRIPEALQAVDETVAAARRLGERMVEASALLLRAEIDADAPDGLDPARRHAEEALAVCTTHALRPVEAHCRRVLGGLLARGGDPSAARHHALAALRLYRDMGMTRWLDQTTTLLDDRDAAARETQPVS